MLTSTWLVSVERALDLGGRPIARVGHEREAGQRFGGVGQRGLVPANVMVARGQSAEQRLGRITTSEAEEPHQRASAAHSDCTALSGSRPLCRARASDQTSVLASCCRAHTAMARTSGEPSSSKASTSGIRP